MAYKCTDCLRQWRGTRKQGKQCSNCGSIEIEVVHNLYGKRKGVKQ